RCSTTSSGPGATGSASDSCTSTTRRSSGSRRGASIGTATSSHRCGARRSKPRNAGRYPGRVPYYICPKCKERSLDIDAREGFSSQAPACRHCGFGFLFELLDDYYPAPDTGLLVTDQDRRVLAIGRGIYELTGFPESDLMGRDVVDALHLSDAKPVELAREWG